MRFTFLFLTMLACGAATPANGDQNTKQVTAKPSAEVTTVATWKGGSISSTDLDETLKTELIQLESEYVNSRYEARKNGLDAAVAEKLMEAEVAKQGLANVEALLKEGSAGPGADAAGGTIPPPPAS